MNLAPAGITLSFEVTYDSPSLHVGMTVYNVTTTTPVLVQGPLAMPNIVGNTYCGRFSGAQGQSYLIFKAVYTSSALNTFDDNYSQASETIVAEDVGGGGGGGSVGDQLIGYVLPNNELIGLVNC